MNEYTVGWAASLAGLGAVVASAFYWLGGRANKWLRRFVSPAITTATFIGCSLIMSKFSWWSFGIYPLMALGYSLGYGGSTLIEKIIKRFICATVVMSPGILMCLVYGASAWALLPWQLLVGYTSIYLGVKNPTYAPAEEAFIAMVYNIGILAYPFVV